MDTETGTCRLQKVSGAMSSDTRMYDPGVLEAFKQAKVFKIVTFPNQKLSLHCSASRRVPQGRAPTDRRPIRILARIHGSSTKAVQKGPRTSIVHVYAQSKDIGIILRPQDVPYGYLDSLGVWGSWFRPET